MPVPQPAVCNTTEELLKEMNDEGSTAMVTSNYVTKESGIKTTTVWINAKNEITVTIMYDINGISVSCMVAIGTTDTRLFFKP